MLPGVAPSKLKRRIARFNHVLRIYRDDLGAQFLDQTIELY